MKLLIITQKVDKNDDVLGFFHRWVEVFSTTFEKVTVICLYKGQVELPAHIQVLSLGKEEGESRIKYLKRFFTYIWKYRKEYDTVFVHMNIEYILLGTWLWKLLRKKVAIWYNHTYGTWKGKLAFMMADKIFHTSPFAFSAGRKKSVRMPAGIDTELFKNDSRITPLQNSILYVGRISRVKNVDTLIKAGITLDTQHIPFTLDVYGSPDKTEGEYNKKVRALSADLEKKGLVSYKGSVPNYKTPPIYNLHQVFVNLTPRGNYDKTILEAMACERISIVSSEAFKESLPEQFLFKERDSQDLAEKLKAVFLMSQEEKAKWGKQMREYVIKTHSLRFLGEKLKEELSDI